MDICRTLCRRRIAVRGAPAAATSCWFDLFHEFFLAPTDAEDEDDLLFFIRDSTPSRQAPPPPGPIFVQRKPADGECPKIEGPVRWEETFYINLITRLHYRVQVSVCREGRRIDAWQGRVFAEPIKQEHDSEEVEYSFPTIHFTVHELGRTLCIGPGESMCVELKATDEEEEEEGGDVLDAPPSASESYTAWRNGKHAVVLFQGAVSYESLLAVKKKKSKGLSTKPSLKVSMRGPEGRGIAQARISELPTEGGGGGGEDKSTLAFFRRNIERFRETRARQPELFVQLSHISLPWRLIVLDVIRHVDDGRLAEQ